MNTNSHQLNTCSEEPLHMSMDYKITPESAPSSSSSSMVEQQKSATHIKFENKPRNLPRDFVPGEYDVICPRGKQAWNHQGNKYFREITAKG